MKEKKEIIQGIYEIVNTKNNKRYIGSSINIYTRWKEHKRMLKKNEHHSIKLQRAWNKAKDKDIFKFNIIEIIKDKQQLHIIEQQYIDKYDSLYNGYNCSIVDNPIFNNKNITKAEKKRLAIMQYNYFIELYEIYKDKIEISKTYINKLLNKHYEWIQYNKINQLILEYEKYFPVNEYYISLFDKECTIKSYNDKPMIHYFYCFKNSKIQIKNIFLDAYWITKEEWKIYNYRGDKN